MASLTCVCGGKGSILLLGVKQHHLVGFTMSVCEWDKFIIYPFFSYHLEMVVQCRIYGLEQFSALKVS